METPRASSKSSLFLLEMIIAILFLAVAAAVCMRLFAQAHTTGAESENLTRAVMTAQSLTENLKAAPAPEEWLTAAPGARTLRPGELWEFCYSADWGLLAAGDAETAPAFWLQVRETESGGGLWQAETAVYSRGGAEPFLTWPCAVYTAPEGSRAP
ncbi:MAG: hypothetical protein LBK56_03135 [Gracilibacteraceae bacterium]|jgi:hypothetical protein|nr:hypothetical protein [Gracilibacteraceae bacterium]